jgi:hypothetical protein
MTTYKLIRKEHTVTSVWYETEIELSEKDIGQIENLYDNDISAFLDNKATINEDDAYYGGEVVKEKDYGSEIEFDIIPNNDEKI